LLRKAATLLSNLDYKVVTIKGMEVDGMKSLLVNEVLAMLRRGKIGLVMTTGRSPQRDYKIRRLAVDFNIPITLDAHLSYELARAIYKLSADVNRLEALELSEYWRLEKDLEQPHILSHKRSASQIAL
jgi:carbamoyl-phosphate synthase large subunit